jgi:hypothetical protein
MNTSIFATWLTDKSSCTSRSNADDQKQEEKKRSHQKEVFCWRKLNVTIVGKRGANLGLHLIATNPATIAEEMKLEPSMETPDQVQVTISFHPADYSEFRVAAHVAGLDEQAFCALAIHREAARVLGEDRPRQRVVAEMAEV